MTMMARVKLARYLALRDEVNALKKQQELAKQEMLPYFSDARENAAGSKVIDFEEPLKSGGKNYSGVQYTKRVSRTLNEDAVLEWLDKHPEHRDKVLKTVEVVDQDELWDLFATDVIDDLTFKSFQKESVVWAFDPLKTE